MLWVAWPGLVKAHLVLGGPGTVCFLGWVQRTFVFDLQSAYRVGGGGIFYICILPPSLLLWRYFLTEETRTSYFLGPTKRGEHKSKNLSVYDEGLARSVQSVSDIVL